MQPTQTPIVRPATLAVLIACAAMPLFADQRDQVAEQLAQSRLKWEQARKDCAGNYEYTVSFSSWAGFGNQTTIVVRGNEVFERRYRAWKPAEPAPAAPGEAAPPERKETGWTERGDELGTHQEGAPLKTLDDLYADAAAALEADTDPAHTRYTFRANDAGVMLACFHVDTRIADDAPRRGVALDAVKIEPAKPE